MYDLQRSLMIIAEQSGLLQALTGCEKNGILCRNFRQHYAEESDNYAEKTPNYAEISKSNKIVPLACFNV